MKFDTTMDIFIQTAILFLMSLQGCLCQNDSAIEVAVVEDNLTAGDEQEGSALPSNLNMTINLFQNDTNAVDLKLDMNNAMNEQRSIYVIRTNKAGKQVLKKEQIPIEGNIAFYQDKDTGANVMVRCDGFTSGKCDPTLEGSFFVDQVEYGLEPLPFDSPERKKRSVTGNRRGKLYSIFKRKQDKPVKDDFVKESATGPGQSMQMVDRIVDLSEFLSPESASMTMRRRVSHYPKRRPKKQFRTDDTPYEMGLVVLIDYSVYHSWYQRSHQKTHAEKDMEAKSKIRQYMSHVVNGIDLRFQNLKVNRVKVVVSRYIIADTPAASNWTADRLEASPRDLVYADEVLNKLIKWRFRMGMDLPVHDHVILFTGYDLYRPTVANKGVAGFARVKSMCTHTSVSIVEEHGGFNSILTATHEIGHSLGAYHDGHNNSCVGQDNYIMTPIGGSATPSNALNPYQFSPCSQDAFQSYLDSLPMKNCLTDETDIYDEEEFREHLSQEAGQLYGPNEQCKQHLGQSSYYAWGGILGDASEVCTHMACKNSMSDTSFNIYYAARGTSCGNKQWCIDGVCTYSEEAPVRTETCVHGDAQRMFGNKTCSQYISEEPSRCYFSYYNRFCCSSCDRVRRHQRDCEFGNRKKMCDIVDKEARFCYHDDNEKMCCESCKRHHTGVKDCEFGDRIADCEPRRCSNYNYATQCCHTCARINNRVTARVPTAPKPTQSVLFFADHTHTTLSDTGPKANVLPTLSSPLRHTRKLQDNTLLPQKEIKLVTDADISVPALSQNKGGTMKPLVEMQAVPSAKKFKSHGPYVHQNKLDHKARPTQRPLTKPPVRPTAPFRRTSSSTARNHWKQQQQKIKRQRTQNRRQQEKVSPRSRNQYYNTNHSPKYNKHQKVNNPRHSRMMTTTFRTSLNRPSRKQKKFAFPSQKCVKPDATFMSLKCSWLVRLMKGLCSNALLGSICCEPCTPAKKKEFVCKDHQGCTAKTGAQCYNDMVRSKCCATCKRFDTGYPDCRYGDRESHCSLFLHYMPAYTCGTFKQKCCMSCKSSKAQITTITPKTSRNEVHPSKVNPVVSGMAHSSFQDRTQRFRPSHNYKRW